MAVVEIAEEYKKVLWTMAALPMRSSAMVGGVWWALRARQVTTWRGLPQWQAEECPSLRRICVLYSGGGTFGFAAAGVAVAAAWRTAY
jgi:hypothetical protein